MNPAFSEYAATARARIDAELAKQLGSALSEFGDGKPDPQLQRLYEAMRYSLLMGGKRIRPLLVYAAAEAIDGAGVDSAVLDRIACAVEFVHAYSLIHDDLPAMDNDDLRRGKPTCHRAFDEATAILAGDALQCRAYELLTELPGVAAPVALELLRTLTAAAGPRGMVGGQAIDLGSVQRDIDLAQLERMHHLKTGALIRAAVRLGGLAAGAEPERLTALDRYARAIGLSFQVHDDILDVTGDAETLGKTPGADAARAKPTYPALLGLATARDLARELHREALTALADFGTAATPLRDLSAYIIDRRF